jgi:hypothetical protein
MQKKRCNRQAQEEVESSDRPVFKTRARIIVTMYDLSRIECSFVRKEQTRAFIHVHVLNAELVWARTNLIVAQQNTRLQSC